ncbi:MAG TPA: TonB-dependent receptor, partial [Flavobacteriaceae bacterium]|nr:TonB-dependent receptor [Flavobacteriaceae bacterium]
MKNLFSILCLGLSLITAAQQTLSGKITDINNAPIIGAEIYLPQIHKGTVSDFDGQYSLQLPKGKIDIVIAYLGYNTIETSIKITGNTIKDFTLNEALFKMDEVMLSTPFNKLQSHNVMKVESIKIANNSIGATNLTEKMSAIPGIANISTGSGIGKPVIRGLSGNRVLVYTQGIRYENQQFGEKHGLGIDE